MEVVGAENYRVEVMALLQGMKLPTDDLPALLDNFITVQKNGELIGVAGMEQYDNYGLLRSVAVAGAYRDKGIAGSLLNAVEQQAIKKGIKTVYLLTETAPDYFSRKGYRVITRDEVPNAVQKSSEFSHVCPASAIVMIKNL